MKVVRYALGLTFMCALAGWLLVDSLCWPDDGKWRE